MDYNTQADKLLLPEYGRIIQQMIQFATTLPSEEERQQCANTIIRVMSARFPQKKNTEALYLKLWDDMAYMANYQLDIQYPCDIIRREQPPIVPLPYPDAHIRLRHYGKMIQDLIQALSEMDEGEEKTELTKLVIYHMRRTLYDSYPEALSDERILDDLAMLSDGRIQLSPALLSRLKFITPKKNLVPIGNKKKNKRN